jgi:cobyrinic acid a,c-diamide synthase
MRGIVIAGTHSGSGKTTITLGLLAAFKKKGYKVQPFKTGPDFIDTGLHKLITGQVSRNLDLWMCGKDYVIDCFHTHAAADISVVEGVMGMYDGNISTADLAAMLGLPLVLVVDVYGMAESAGAVVKGFAEYSAVGARSPRPELAGVIFNRVASERHYKRVKDSVQDIPVLGYLPRDLDFNIPHRHLGLVVAEEEPIAKEEIEKLAEAMLEHIDIEKIVQKCKSAEVQKHVGARSPRPGIETLPVKIAVAYDKAFCFYYEDNLDLLRDTGAEIVPFSPLNDSSIPDGIHALYIGGGYPELYAEQLSKNTSMLDSVKAFALEGGPVYGECGGFMYLTEGITDFDNAFHEMAGVFPFKTKMKKGRSRLGYREAVLKNNSMLGAKGTMVRGHEFHYSEIVESAEARRGEVTSFSQPEQIYSVKDGSGNTLDDEGYKVKNTLGSYIHIHFGSNPAVAGHLVHYSKEHYGTDTFSRTR